MKALIELNLSRTIKSNKDYCKDISDKRKARENMRSFQRKWETLN